MTSSRGLELWGAPTGNCFRAAIALEEAGLAYRARRVDLAAGEHLGAAYRALNPVGRVPVLVETANADGAGLVLTQSNAILFYAAERSAQLLPADGVARARALEWFFFFVTDVIAPSNQASALTNNRIDGSGAAWLEGRALSMLQHADRRLGDAAYLAGDTFSLADIAGFTIARWLRAKLASPLSNVERWYEAVGARPAVARGLAAFG